MGGVNLSGSGSDFGFEKVPANVSTTEPFECSPDEEGAPRAPSRHLKMIMHEPHELQLSEAEVTRRQQGMCMGCMRTLGAVYEVMHEAPVDTWRGALQSRSSIVAPHLWEHGSLGGRALETIGSIQNLLTPKHRTERPRRCFYDGGMYCEACHSGQVRSPHTVTCFFISVARAGLISYPLSARSPTSRLLATTLGLSLISGLSCFRCSCPGCNHVASLLVSCRQCLNDVTSVAPPTVVLLTWIPSCRSHISGNIDSFSIILVHLLV